MAALLRCRKPTGLAAVQRRVSLPCMTDEKRVTLYLTEYLLWRVRRGKSQFLGELLRVFDSRGWRVQYRGNSLEDRMASVARPGWALFYEDEPMPGRCLTMRRSYLDPFWHIERTGKRWDWDVAKTPFQPDAVDPNRAAQFGNFWRKRMNLPAARPGQGIVYVPLQGRLLSQRSFQSMSPIDMVRAVAKREKSRQIVMTLHPGETYSDLERAALDKLMTDPRIVLAASPMEDILPQCDYVATQNSSVAISAYFLEKPVVLFGQIDFHHIAGSVPRDGLAAAFDHLSGPAPDYARYLYWFFQDQSLNVWRPDFADRLTKRFEALGLTL